MRGSQIGSMRGSESVSKVEGLLMRLMETSTNLELVLPFLPAELKEWLSSEELALECQGKFEKLDTDRSGRLDPGQVVPMIAELTEARSQAIKPEQVKRFIEFFDFDEDGQIKSEEFSLLVQFVIITSYLDSEEGRELVEVAQVEEDQFDTFLRMIETDRERLWDIIPFLPVWLSDYISSDECILDTLAQFDELDTDKSNALEPNELFPVLLNLSEAHPLTLDINKCKRFTKVFDVHGNGVIQRDEFVDFMQFLLVMNFMSSTVEGRVVEGNVESAGFAKDIDVLSEDPAQLPKVLSALPKIFVAEIMGDNFINACKDAFKAADKGGSGLLDPAVLHPTIVELAKALLFDLDIEKCKNFATIFDKDKKGVISMEQFVNLAQFSMVLTYLISAKDNNDALSVDVVMGKEKIDRLLKQLKGGTEELDVLITFLPQGFKDALWSEGFQDQCLKSFTELDTDSSGYLDPAQCIPLILEMTDSHQLSLSQSHVLRFVDIFDVERNGVITKSEFLSFARFIMIMAFLDTPEGKVVLEGMDEQVTIAEGESRVEDLLKLLEADRMVVHKVLPLLPSTIFEALTSDAFVTSCRERFIELDTDQNGYLDPNELWPVVCELSAAHPFTVDEESCRRFTSIFDLHGDGVIRLDEFLDFARFLCIMTFLNSDEGKKSVADAAVVMEGSKTVEDLLENLKRDHHEIRQIVPYLPDALKSHLFSDQFTRGCRDRFAELDKDKNGTLEPLELFPVIVSMANVHQLALDHGQCERFIAIFDEGCSGVITGAEFVKFARFVMAMGYLQTEDGQQVVDAAWRDRRKQQHEPSALDTRDATATVGATSQTGGNSTFAPPTSTTLQASQQVATQQLATEATHLQVDLDYYQSKAQRLREENDLLLEKQFALESTVRRLQQELEEQERRLRHASVDLRTTTR